MKKTGKFRKVMAASLAALLAAGVFAGCSGGGGENGKTQISISPWPSKEGAELDTAMAGKAEFEAENPDFEIVGDSWKFDIQSFYPKAEAGMLPTVFTLPLTEIEKINDGGYYKDLKKALKDNDLYDYLSDAVLDLVTNEQGEIVGWPWNMYSIGLGVNIDMFEAAGLMEEDGTPKQPKDWNELAEFAVKIKKATGKSGFALQTSGNQGGWLFTSIAWSYGANFMEKGEDGKWKATFNSPEAAEALQFIKDLKWKYDVLPSSTNLSGNDVFQLFAVGNTAMMLGSQTISASVATYDMKPESVGIVAIPAGPKSHVSLIGGSIFCVSNKATDKQTDGVVKYEKRSYSPMGGDDVKEARIRRINNNISKGQAIGIEEMSPWRDDAPYNQLIKGLYKEYTNINLNHVRLYNEAQEKGEIEFRTEEPVCAQDLYGILDNCIQNVLTDENADCAAVLEKANSDFQTNFLNNITY